MVCSKVNSMDDRGRRETDRQTDRERERERYRACRSGGLNPAVTDTQNLVRISMGKCPLSLLLCLMNIIQLNCLFLTHCKLISKSCHELNFGSSSKYLNSLDLDNMVVSLTKLSISRFALFHVVVSSYKYLVPFPIF